MGKKKRFNSVLISLSVFMFFGLFVNDVLAYTPQSLYDDVWKLVNTKYVDQENNGQTWTKWRHKYDKEIKTDQDAYVAIDTMVSSLNDPYTRFLTPDEFAEEGRSINGKLKGIGVQIGIKEDKLTVIAPIEDTPAAKAGLQANDLILEINGKSTKGISVKDAADKIRGEEGTFVKLLVQRGDKPAQLYSIQRKEISIKSVSTTASKSVKLKENVGYIKLSSFLSKSASDELYVALNDYKQKDGYILDLRSNPGGLLTNAIFISNMFLNGGTIVSTVDRDGYKETQRASKQNLTNKPLVVLINGGSASASEILSGALKDNSRAVLIGEKSFGKGLVQEIDKLPGGSGLNITTQKYLTPNGTDINKKGIEPDVAISNTDEDIKKEYDRQLEKAQEVLIDLISKNQTSLSKK